MLATAAIVLQLAGVALILAVGPWGLVPGLGLLALGAWAYRKAQRERPAPSRLRRGLAWALCGAALAAGLAVAVNPWREDADAGAARAAAPAAVPGGTRDCVLVLHGLVNRSMDGLAQPLVRAGFAVSAVTYPSTRGTVETMLVPLAAAVSRRAASCERIHFVGYSLGALLLRAYLGSARPPQTGRVVMIAPPNHGTELVDALSGLWLFRRMVGDVGASLGTSPRDLPATLPPPSYPLGVIAGDVARNPLGLWLIPAPHDGTVSVASTRLDGMSDFLLVHRTHHFIVRAPEVAQQTIEFLRHGRFRPGATSSSR